MTNIIGAALIVLSVETNYPETYRQQISCEEAKCPNATHYACWYYHNKPLVASNVVQIITTIGAGKTPLFKILDQRSDGKWYDWQQWRDGLFIQRIDRKDGEP